MSLTIASPGFQPLFCSGALCRCRRAGGAGGPKRYHPLQGGPWWRIPSRRCVPCLALMRPWSCYRLKMIQFERHVPDWRGDGAWVARVGGASRAHSVANGLNELLERGAQPRDWVLVHDAARCLISVDAVNRLIDACLPDEVGGILALPLADTLKTAVQDLQGLTGAAETIDRSAKWTAQTPQMFRLGLLRPALMLGLSSPELAASIADEASAIEGLGHQPLLVRGDYEKLQGDLAGRLCWPRACCGLIAAITMGFAHSGVRARAWGEFGTSTSSAALGALRLLCSTGCN